MGVYTEFKIDCCLRKDLPVEIKELFICLIYGQKAMFDKWWYIDTDEYKEILYRNNGEISLPDHPFFKMDRWSGIFSVHAFVNTTPQFARLSILKGGVACRTERYYLQVHGEINHGLDTVLAFVDWLTPYVEGHSPKKFIGYYEVDNCYNTLTNIYVDRSKKNDELKRP